MKNQIYIPIVFIHTGYSEYMEYSLRQAKYSNPNSNIILIGDDKNNLFPFIHHIKIKNYYTSAKKLSKVYKHYSTNSYNYEIFCIQRWFILNDYLDINNISECFVCDTDVMIYSNISDTLTKYNKEQIAVLKRGEEYSFGISHINADNLQKFCEYILKAYNDNSCINNFENYYSSIIKNKKLGGISDMILVEKWITQFPDTKIINLLDVVNNGTFDDNICSAYQKENDYYEHKNIKVIKWKNNIPYCYSYKHKSLIKFHLLHFQGPTKYLMSKYYTGNSFKGKTKLDIKFFFANIVAYWYKKLKIRYRFAWLFNIAFKLKQK